MVNRLVIMVFVLFGGLFSISCTKSTTPVAEETVTPSIGIPDPSLTCGDAACVK